MNSSGDTEKTQAENITDLGIKQQRSDSHEFAAASDVLRLPEAEQSDLNGE